MRGLLAVPLAFLIAFGPCEISAASATGHLFIGFGGFGERAFVKRYPLFDGLPASEPDHVYQRYRGPLAVAGDGTLYAIRAHRRTRVYAFAPGASEPNRYVELPNLVGHCSGVTDILALAADAAGYLYVAYSAEVSGLGTAPGRPTRGSPNFTCDGILIYGPTQKGRARPLRVLHYGGYDTRLVVDRGGDVFVSDDYSGPQFWEIATPLSRPRLIREFSLAGVYVYALAIDAAGTLFAAYLSRDNNRIAVALFAWAVPALSGTLGLPAQEYPPSIAAWGHYLYVGDPFAQTVAVYDAVAGSSSPIATVQVGAVTSVVVGN